jgi:hypothetical protein
MGGFKRKVQETNELRRGIFILEKRWWKQMRKVMKRSDQSRKEIDFESSHRKELEEL